MDSREVVEVCSEILNRDLSDTKWCKVTIPSENVPTKTDSFKGLHSYVLFYYIVQVSEAPCVEGGENGDKLR